MLPELHRWRRPLRGPARHGHTLPQVRGAYRHVAKALRSALIPLVALLAALSAHAAEPQPVQVFAASSLTDVLPKVAEAWKVNGGDSVTFNFDASSRLASQIASGAPADAFVSADVEWMAELEKKGRVDASSRMELLSNQLVVVVPTGSGLSLSAPKDLATKGVRRLALGGENVPVGRYAREALTKLGVLASVGDRVVNGSNVRQALELAARGEVDAAIVYRTDALVEPRVRVAFALAPETHSPIVYPAAVLRNASHADAARRFLAFCRTDVARKIFEAAGFGLLPASR